MEADQVRSATMGLRLIGGGPHQSKTLMLADLSTVCAQGADDQWAAIVRDNILGKPSQRGRKAAYKALAAMYGLGSGTIVSFTLNGLWARDPDGRPLLALLGALARDSTLRDGAAPVLDATLGEAVHARAIAAAFAAAHHSRLGRKMLASLSRNAASTWTKVGCLAGKIRTRRRVACIEYEFEKDMSAAGGEEFEQFL